VKISPVFLEAGERRFLVLGFSLASLFQKFRSSFSSEKNVKKKKNAKKIEEKKKKKRGRYIY
jgi:hypothetical protein